MNKLICNDVCKSFRIGNDNLNVLKNSCDSDSVERYQPGVIPSGCPYKNPGGIVGIPSV